MDYTREWELAVDWYGRGRVRCVRNGFTHSRIELTDAETRMLASEIDNALQLIIRARSVAAEKDAASTRGEG